MLCCHAPSLRLVGVLACDVFCACDASALPFSAAGNSGSCPCRCELAPAKLSGARLAFQRILCHTQGDVALPLISEPVFEQGPAQMLLECSCRIDRIQIGGGMAHTSLRPLKLMCSCSCFHCGYAGRTPSPLAMPYRNENTSGTCIPDVAPRFFSDV